MLINPPPCDCPDCQRFTGVVIFHMPQHHALLNGVRLWQNGRLGEIISSDGEGVRFRTRGNETIHVRYGSPFMFYMGPGDLTGPRNPRADVFFVHCETIELSRKWKASAPEGTQVVPGAINGQGIPTAFADPLEGGFKEYYALKPKVGITHRWNGLSWEEI